MTTILAIEDESTIRANIVKILEFKGFEVISAEDGDLGVRLAKTHLPDLILCDIMMPSLDGYEVLNLLRQDPDTATIPLIFLSAKSTRQDIRQGMNLGADDYLSKPFSSAELLEAVFAQLQKQAFVTRCYLQKIELTSVAKNRFTYADSLTNLPNRILLRHKLQEAIEVAKSHQETLGVICLNLDRFRTINANYGAHIGDLLLQALAERLSSCLNDQCTIARFYADEFSILLENTSKQEIIQLAEQLLTALRVPYLFTNFEISVSGSIGIAMYPEDSNNPDRLLSVASTAKHWCQRQGGNNYQFYNSALDIRDTEKRSLEKDLAIALAKSEFQLYYQPQVDLLTRQIVGIEALIRWQHFSKGTISPNIFIPIAEESGSIVSISEFVLRTACIEISALKTTFPLKVAINISARHFRQSQFLSNFTKILAETGFNPQQLSIELTETSMMEDIDSAIEVLHQLKTLGINIAVDDFGIGYASLNYLRCLPIDILKIDRSFISQVNDNENDATIVSAIIAMAQNLNLQIVAEGVETKEQLTFLKQRGCHIMQGYLCSPPMPIAEFQQFLYNYKPI